MIGGTLRLADLQEPKINSAGIVGATSKNNESQGREVSLDLEPYSRGSAGEEGVREGPSTTQLQQGTCEDQVLGFGV